MNFILLLSYENWDDVFLEKDVNILLTIFLILILEIFMPVFQILKQKIPINLNCG